MLMFYNEFSARATFSMLTLLALAGMFGSLSSSTPKISYTTKMDTWMLASMIFVFLTLLELVAALVYKMYLSDYNKNRKNVSNINDSPKVWAIIPKDNNHDTATKQDIDKKLAFAENCFALVYFSVVVIFYIQYWITI